MPPSADDVPKERANADASRHEEQKLTSKKLFIQNITRHVTDKHLEEIFGRWGKVVSVNVPKVERIAVNKGFAIVEFDSVASAEDAATRMNGGQLDGVSLQVSLLKPEAAVVREPLDAKENLTSRDERGNDDRGMTELEGTTMTALGDAVPLHQETPMLEGDATSHRLDDVAAVLREEWGSLKATDLFHAVGLDHEHGRARARLQEEVGEGDIHRLQCPVIESEEDLSLLRRTLPTAEAGVGAAAAAVEALIQALVAVQGQGLSQAEVAAEVPALQSRREPQHQLGHGILLAHYLQRINNFQLRFRNPSEMLDEDENDLIVDLDDDKINPVKVINREVEETGQLFYIVRWSDGSITKVTDGDKFPHANTLSGKAGEQMQPELGFHDRRI
ncbi:hypothetical protein HDU97_003912 [Phlyctochytrium planicorne]|nr:hypothetical protein HDU97_003912 [Phlyctochytrium planicorne]